MAIALDEARLAMQSGEVPVGAVLIDDEGGVVVRAHNLCERETDATAHAEMLAIREAEKRLSRWRLTGCTLYVTLEPCCMCAGAIGWAQVSRVVFGAHDPKRGFGRLAPNALHPKCTVSSDILADECMEKIQQFFQQKRL